MKKDTNKSREEKKKKYGEREGKRKMEGHKEAVRADGEQACSDKWKE